MNKSGNVTSKQLIRNSLYSVIARIVYVGIGFLIIPYLIVNLGIESYGVWILIGSIFRYRDIFSLGLNSAVNRYIPHYLATNEKNQISKVIDTAFIFYICSSLLFIFVTIIIYLNLTSWFVIPHHLQNVSQLLVLITGIGFSLLIPLNLNSAIISSFQRFDILNIGILLHVTIRAILIIVLLFNNYNLIAIGLTFVITEIGLKIAYLIYSRKLLTEISFFPFKNIDIALLKNMLSYGINTFLFTISIVVIYRSSEMLLGIYKSVEDIANYSVLIVLILVLHQLLQAFLSIIKPAISYLNANDNKERIEGIAFLTQKYSLLFLIPSSAFFLLFGGEFLTVWLGEDFAQLNQILTVLIIGNFLFLTQLSNYFVLVGKGEHRIYGIVAISTAICSILLIIISLGYFNWGLLSVAISTSIPMVLISGIFLQIYFNKKMNIRINKTIKSAWFPAIRGTVPAILILLALKYFFLPTNWIHIALIIIFIALITLIGTISLSTDHEERKVLSKFIKSAVGRNVNE